MTRSRPLPHEFRDRPFTHQEALLAGVTARRLRAADLQRPFHGRRTVAPPDSLLSLCHAFAAGMPSDAFFSSTTALQLYGAPLPRDADAVVHVSVPRPRRALSARGVAGHSVTVFPDELTHVDGLRVSVPERAWCEASHVLGLADLVAAADDIAHREIVSVESVGGFVSRYPARRHRAVLLEATGLIDPRCESRPESLVRLILGAAGIRVVPQWEVRVARRRLRIDLAIPEFRVAIEYHGDHHRESRQWRNDVDRRGVLEDAGWIVVEIVAPHLADPALIVERVRRAITRSASYRR